MRRPTTESVILGCVLAGAALCLVGGFAFAQGSWEFLGPGVGYRPDAFFVSKHAIYLGLSEDDRTGLGLYRYRFASGQWDQLAWPGYNIYGVTVWGEADENILVTTDRPGDWCYVQRSTDGGATWMATHADYFILDRLTQAPSDTSHILISDPLRYSTDAGWSWRAPHGGPQNWPSHARFDPADANLAYCVGGSAIETIDLFNSLDGGANWHQLLYACWFWEIEVGWNTPGVMMASTLGQVVDVSTDSGHSWTARATPFDTNVIRSLPWWPGCFFISGANTAETFYQVWRTTDLGGSWFQCGDGLPELPVSLYYASMFLEGHPTEPTLYVALEGSGVWRWHLSGAGAPDAELPQENGIQLLLYPNPSSSPSSCRVRLMSSDDVSLRLFDARGRLVQTLQEGLLPAGVYTFSWREGTATERRAASGIYYLRLDAGGVHEERKIVVLK